MVKIPEIHIAIGNTQHTLEGTIEKLIHAKNEASVEEAYKLAKIQLLALYNFKLESLEDIIE